MCGEYTIRMMNSSGWVISSISGIFINPDESIRVQLNSSDWVNSWVAGVFMGPHGEFIWLGDFINLG